VWLLRGKQKRGEKINKMIFVRALRVVQVFRESKQQFWLKVFFANSDDLCFRIICCFWFCSLSFSSFNTALLSRQKARPWCVVASKGVASKRNKKGGKIKTILFEHAVVQRFRKKPANKKRW